MDKLENIKSSIAHKCEDNIESLMKSLDTMIFQLLLAKDETYINELTSLIEKRNLLESYYISNVFSNNNYAASLITDEMLNQFSN